MVIAQQASAIVAVRREKRADEEDRAYRYRDGSFNTDLMNHIVDGFNLSSPPSPPPALPAAPSVPSPPPPLPPSSSQTPPSSAPLPPLSSSSSASARKGEGGKKRKKHTIALKAQIVEKVRGGALKSDIGAEYGVDRSHVSRWCKEGSKIMEESKKTTRSHKIARIVRSTLPAAFENGVLLWIRFMRSQTPPATVTYDIVSTKAKEIRDELLTRISQRYPAASAAAAAPSDGVVLSAAAVPSQVIQLTEILRNCKFSHGWAEKFFSRHSLSSVQRHGEGGSSPMDLVNRGRLDLRSFLENF